MKTKVIIAAVIIAAAALLALVSIPSKKDPATRNTLSEIRLDYANWSPVGLVLRQQGYLEEDLKKDGIRVRWVFSQGSNKSMEFLRSGSVDVGSSAGVAALISFIRF